jgi:hypothetical protein
VLDTPAEGDVFCYRYRLEGRRSAQSGPASLTLGRMQLESATTREALDVLYCVLHFGAADFRCGLAPHQGEAHHAEVEAALFSRLEKLSFHRVLREIDRVFPGRDYALRDLFLDERRRVANAMLEGTLRRYEDRYLDIFEDNRRLMEFLREIDSPIPAPLRVAADVTLTERLVEVLRRTRAGEVNLEAAERELGAVVELARRLGAHLHLAPVRRDVRAIVLDRLAALAQGRSPAARAAECAGVLELAERLGLRVDLWEAQNRLWDWAGSKRVTLDRETAAGLARRLWFDEGALLARAGYAAD